FRSTVRQGRSSTATSFGSRLPLPSNPHAIGRSRVVAYRRRSCAHPARESGINGHLSNADPPMLASDIHNRLGPRPSQYLVEFARLAVRAGELARTSLKRRPVADMRLKGARDYQTEVDVAVERMIVEGVAAAFPDVAIRGEEAVGDRSAGDGAPTVHIDPIDGTTNFAWGIPHFGIV